MADDYEGTTNNDLTKLDGKSAMRIPTKHVRGIFTIGFPQHTTKYKL